jgi:hypothetical protein
MIAVDKKRKPLLFYDTVENGDQGTNTMGGWLRNDKGYELVLSIAS